MPGTTRILVVDEPSTTELLTTVLSGRGFAVDTARTAEQAVAQAVARRPDLVLLDVSLPDGDGRDVCRRLRAEGTHAEVVFLTARDDRNELIEGLAYGDDDWITKPFDVDVLLARVHAVLRRAGDAHGGRVLRHADVELDPDTGEVRRAGEPVPLTPAEAGLLQAFLRNPGRVLSPGALPVDPDVVDASVRSLRAKLDRLGPPLIATHHGFGYALRAGLP